MITETRSSLVGAVFPVAESRGESRFMRRWVVRSRELLPEQEILDKIARRLLKWVNEKIVESAYPVEVEEWDFADLAIRRIGVHHCVVYIECPASPRVAGDAAAIATWGTLEELDKVIRIEDLAGIPREFWLLLPPMDSA